MGVCGGEEGGGDESIRFDSSRWTDQKEERSEEVKKKKGRKHIVRSVLE